MKMKLYNSPEISIEVMDNADVITTSDVTLGTTTSTIESGIGSWEVIG